MKHTLKVLFYLKKNESKEDGTCPVMGRITVSKNNGAVQRQNLYRNLALGYALRQGKGQK